MSLETPRMQFGRRGIAVLRAIARAATEFIYPRTCPLCGRQPAADDGEFTAVPLPGFCDDCRNQLVDAAPQCQCCGAPVGPHLTTEHGCWHCRGDRFAFETVRSLGSYEGRLRDAVHRAKQPNGRAVAAALAELIWRQHGAFLAGAEPQWVIPVPAHWRERFAQPHNAAETLARVLARRLKAGYGGPILSKVRHTRRQRSLNYTERRTNLRGAFRSRTGTVVSGTTVLLVDDVLTTGTTAHEAARPLLAAGVRRVIVAVACRGLGHDAPQT